jgi:NAD(P)-dependent dehydrogenase (short-subunit alcohol dehydrogenase family)
VVLLCRSAEKAEAAKADITSGTGNEKVHVLVCDLASQREIRAAARQFRSQFSKLDVLVNNAGAFFSEMKKTSDGVERQFAINHLGPFLLTNLLLEPLKASGAARVLVVSSNAHFNGKINFKDINLEKTYVPVVAYAQSKLANVLFSNELARRERAHGITSNALHPGVVRTKIGQANSNWFYGLMWSLVKPFMISAEKGAVTSLMLASDPSLEGVSGKFFADCKEKDPNPVALNEDLARRLWELSEQLTAGSASES